MALKLVFNVEGVKEYTIYEFASYFYNKGFTLNPKATGLKMKDTRVIIVDLQEKVLTPLCLYVIETSKNHIFFNLKD